MLLKKQLLSLLMSCGLLAAASVASANSGGAALDHFPVEKLSDQASLQNGAKLFVNYCLNCHSASAMRYNRMKDIGLTDEQIKANLAFTTDKIGEPMKAAISAKDAKEWFGAAPPDLSVTARARASSAGSGSDWIYTYLRSYYRDSTRATGWNNALFPNVGMPNVLWQLQGASRGAKLEEIKPAKDETGKLVAFNKVEVNFDANGERAEKVSKLEGLHHHESSHLTLGSAKGGTLDQAAFDGQVADLTAFITYMGDPSAKSRVRLGVWVLIFLGLFSIFAWRLNASYWKDVK
jgi:ubiquinol-cytochrome c reductase cytochrome c1 subunit